MCMIHIFFNSTWAEQNPDDWWKAICENNEELLKEIDKKQVAGMAFSGQMMGCVPELIKMEEL